MFSFPSQVTNVVFRDNQHAGRFVKWFVKILSQEIAACVDLGVRASCLISRVFAIHSTFEDIDATSSDSCAMGRFTHVIGVFA
jgi:hypothetical protein